MILAGCGQVFSTNTDSQTTVPLLGLTLPPLTPTPILRLLRTPTLRTTSIFTRTLIPTPLPVALESPTCYETPVGSLWCLGVVHNTLTTPVGRITIHIYLVRSDGTSLLDQQVTVARNVLAPGESAPYGALFNAMPADAAGPVAILVSTEATTDIKSVAVRNIQSEMQNGQYHVTGTLVNTDTKPLDNLSVVVTLYDAKGAVTGFRQLALPTDQSLAPAASLPFTLDVIAQGPGTTRVEANAEGHLQ
jgi:hypothetical protein